jgi:hypothetical protein
VSARGIAVVGRADTRVKPLQKGVRFFIKIQCNSCFSPYGDTDVPIGTINVAVASVSIFVLPESAGDTLLNYRVWQRVEQPGRV